MQLVNEMKDKALAELNLATDKKSADLAAYHHGAAFSPTHDTFIKAIERNYFFGWPGLTSSLIKKHLPNNIATESGHLRQEQHSLRSTKIRPTTAATATTATATTTIATTTSLLAVTMIRAI